MNDNDLEFFNIIEDQLSVKFTGKINILSKQTAQFLGYLALYEGEPLNSSYRSKLGLKAFYSIAIDEHRGVALDFVVEPELVEGLPRNIHYPYSVLKSKINKILEDYKFAAKNAPPSNIKLMVNPSFIKEGEAVTSNEYDVMMVLSDYNRVGDLYKNCHLMEFEITNALVSLRKKNAIKVLASQKE